MSKCKYVRIQKESPVLSILITNIYSIRTLVALVGGFPSEKNARQTRSSAISPTDLHDISMFVLVQAPWFTVNSMDIPHLLVKYPKFHSYIKLYHPFFLVRSPCFMRNIPVSRILAAPISPCLLFHLTRHDLLLSLHHDLSPPVKSRRSP